MLGAGIGSEIIAVLRRILKTAASVERVEHQVGITAIDAGQQVQLEATIEAIKGPCINSVGTGFKLVNVQLRQRLKLYGDVISDLCVGLVGGLGVVLGAKLATIRQRSKRSTVQRPPLPGRAS